MYLLLLGLLLNIVSCSNIQDNLIDDVSYTEQIHEKTIVLDWVVSQNSFFDFNNFKEIVITDKPIKDIDYIYIKMYPESDDLVIIYDYFNTYNSIPYYNVTSYTANPPNVGVKVYLWRNNYNPPDFYKVKFVIYVKYKI